MISVTLKTHLGIRLGICIYKTSLLHQPDDYIGFTSSCPPTFSMTAHSDHYTNKLYKFRRGSKKIRGSSVSLRTLVKFVSVALGCHNTVSVAEQLHCSLHVKELKVTTTELERQIGN